MSSGIEREVKLAADPQWVFPDLGSLVKQTVRLSEQHLSSTYFDSRDHRLWVRKITLRHRIGESIESGVWTLKLPENSTGPTLDRTELEWAGPLDRVPGRVVEILQGILRRAPLEKIASLEADRRRLLLRGPTKNVLAEVDDDSVTIRGGPYDGRRFRQIELEVHEADTDLLKRCIKRLRRSGAWLDDGAPKLARAIGEPDDVPIPSLGPTSTIGDVVTVCIRNGFDRIVDHDYLLRLRSKDPTPESIHQARVATRRLRSDLKTFKSMLDPLWVRHTRDDLKWLGGVLGRVRDADVLAAHLDLAGPDRMGDADGESDLRERLRSERTRGVVKVAAALQSERYLLLLDKLHASADRPPFRARGGRHHGWADEKAVDVIPRIVGKTWKQLGREVRKAGDRPSDAQLHRIRIRAKAVRYAAEMSAPVMGTPADRTTRAAEDLQTHLGGHHDAVVASEWLRRWATGTSSGTAFAAGLLAGEQMRQQRRLRRGWRVPAKNIDRTARRWLR